PACMQDVYGKGKEPQAGGRFHRHFPLRHRRRVVVLRPGRLRRRIRALRHAGGGAEPRRRRHRVRILPGPDLAERRSERPLNFAAVLRYEWAHQRSLPMNVRPKIATGYSACPHDCPSTCALEVEIVDPFTIGRVRGARDHSYTAGVVCAKVARYAERIHNPDRVKYPLRRKGEKGSGTFERISWDDALDEIAEAFVKAEQRYGPETV